MDILKEKLQPSVINFGDEKQEKKVNNYVEYYRFAVCRSMLHGSDQTPKTASNNQSMGT